MKELMQFLFIIVLTIWLTINVCASVPAFLMALSCDNGFGNGRYENIFPLSRLVYWTFDQCPK